MRDREYLPIFVCGLMGSGTTLITRLIDQHYYTIGVANESALHMPRKSPLRIRAPRRYTNIAELTNAMVLPEGCPPEAIRAWVKAYYRGVTRRTNRTNVILDKAPAAHMLRTRQLKEAFPDSKFLLMFRDPVSSVEGLRRKWDLFARSSLADVCTFWERLHKKFALDTEPFQGDVIAVLYNNLVRDPQRVLAEIADNVGLERREEPLPYNEKPDREGFGVRNVVGGKIVMDTEASVRAVARMTPEERSVIERRLLPLYTSLIERYRIETFQLWNLGMQTDRNSG